MATRGRSQFLLLLVLLALLGGSAAWNYDRNARIEEAEFRPFKGYSDDDLETLRAAYDGQLGERSSRYQAAAQQQVSVRSDGLIGEQVREFERVQGVSRLKRALASDVAESQVVLDQIRDEQRLRSRDRPIYKMYMRRILTF